MCVDEVMAYCEHEQGRRYSTERREKKWDKNARDYISEGDWDYCLKGEASVSDPEQSFLSRFVFAKLMDFDTDIILANKIKIEKNDLVFHFDLMNHMRNDEYENYYSIGNLAPIPAKRIPYLTKDGKDVSAHLQFIHRWNNEKWDLLLKHLKNNWNIKDLAFNKYMMDTCQQLYFKRIFESFYNEYKHKNLNKIDWNQYVSDWNILIKEDENMELVSFDYGNDYREKIKFLIEARGRCILGCLGNKNYTP